MVDNRILIVDTILQQVAEELDIPPSKFQQAVERYEAVGHWLERGHYAGSSGEPAVFPQGSFRLGTVVRPIREGKESDYDIDLVCELSIPKSSTHPRNVKHDVGDRLKENGTYKRMLDDEGKRCWTLLYAEEDGVGFHLDVLPCVPDPLVSGEVEPRFAEQTVALTDKSNANDLYDWGTTNPAGYADWFAERQRVALARISALRKTQILLEHADLFARIEDVPDQLVRTPLQRTIQVLKRHRDVRFAGQHDEADKPISMIVTTLAAVAYQQQSDVYSTLAGFLDKVRQYQETGIIQCENDEWRIANPVNPDENFADRWNEPGNRKADAFFQWINWVQEDIDDILNVSSRTVFEKKLRSTFGDMPGRRVATNYTGQMPGVHLPATSLFGRVSSRQLRFDVAHRDQPKWHIRPSGHSVRIAAKYLRNGFRPTAFRSNSPALPKRIGLLFEAQTNVPKPYMVYWQVVNTGHEAANANQLRGDFYDSDKTGKRRKESTQYKGMHWVECFVVKNGVCVARSGEFVVNIV